MVYAVFKPVPIVSKKPLKTKRTMSDHTRKIDALLQNNTIIAGRSSSGEPFIKVVKNEER